jgi:putative hydrolase of the HAD superfamily
MKPAVLFDLGNTLAAYYRADEFRPILETAITRVSDELRERRLAEVSLEAALSAAWAENREAPDFRFRPMADRLERIFGISLSHDPRLAGTLCANFLEPIFALGKLYADTLPVLSALRDAGYGTAIVSNTPWGSPAALWRRELQRLGLTASVDCVVLCGDVGWRKPAPQIFAHAARRLDRRPEECLFVGDDLNWDIAGAAAAGMRPVLIDRDRRHANHAGARVRGLHGVLEVLTAGVNR